MQRDIGFHSALTNMIEILKSTNDTVKIFHIKFR